MLLTFFRHIRQHLVTASLVDEVSTGLTANTLHVVKDAFVVCLGLGKGATEQ